MEDEHPILTELGLALHDITGDGNCLFRALADQLFGDESRHAHIRRETVAYMAKHADEFTSFMDGDETLSKRCTRMKKYGVYGDNMEIVAFAKCFGVGVKIYHARFAYLIAQPRCDGGAGRRVMHIAYHSWEHYSSIHDGHGRRSSGTTSEEAVKTEPGSEWKEAILTNSLPYVIGCTEAKRALERANGNLDLAIEQLLTEPPTKEEAPEAAPVHVKVREKETARQRKERQKSEARQRKKQRAGMASAYEQSHELGSMTPKGTIRI